MVEVDDDDELADDANADDETIGADDWGSGDADMCCVVASRFVYLSGMCLITERGPGKGVVLQVLPVVNACRARGVAAAVL